MHIGNVYSFLLAWLVSRRSGARILLRIEDIDRARCRDEWASLVMDDLAWLGLEWDEGPVFQHDRLEAYREAFEELKRKRLVYPCFCTRAQWHAASAPHAGEGFVYPGSCRLLGEEERARRLAACQRPVSQRFFVGEGSFSFTDRFQGLSSYELQREVGDCVIMRSDQEFSYQLAVVVDDAAEGVTQIVRGSDLMPSVPVQHALQKALGFAHPEYWHIPVLTASDGHRLAKRSGDVDMGFLRERLKSPERIIGLVAGLSGLVPGLAAHEGALQGLSLDELLERWNPDACRSLRKVLEIPVF